MQTAIAPTPKTNGSVQTTKVRQTKLDEVVYSVYLTYDYGKFKIMPDNRNINLLHVRRLVESFRRRHLVSPIIVNQFLEVIDGQHRLQAAKETKYPIHYIVVDGYAIEEVTILNTNQKNWQKIDYLHSYCSEGRKPYLEFKKFMDDFPDFGIQPAERILTGLTYGRKQGLLEGKKVHLKSFEEGKLNIPNLSNSYQVARKLLDFKPFYENFNRGTFVSAMIPLFKSKNYNHKEMIHKLSVCPIKLQDCQNVEAYRLLLEDIYNHKRLKENKVSFRYE
jgi:hypothetical protein